MTKEELLKQVANSKTYTVQVAEAMPADRYSYKPARAPWTFGELMYHTAYGIRWWEANEVRGLAETWNPPLLEAYTKENVTQPLVQAFESLTNTVEASTFNEKLTRGVWSTLDHVTHHRGQAVLYLRMTALVPPEYLF